MDKENVYSEAQLRSIIKLLKLPFDKVSSAKRYGILKKWYNDRKGLSGDELDNVIKEDFSKMPSKATMTHCYCLCGSLVAFIEKTESLGQAGYGGLDAYLFKAWEFIEKACRQNKRIDRVFRPKLTLDHIKTNELTKAHDKIKKAKELIKWMNGRIYNLPPYTYAITILWYAYMGITFYHVFTSEVSTKPLRKQPQPAQEFNI